MVSLNERRIEGGGERRGGRKRREEKEREKEDEEEEEKEQTDTINRVRPWNSCHILSRDAIGVPEQDCTEHYIQEQNSGRLSKTMVLLMEVLLT